MAESVPHIVIIGGGFGGLYAARALRRAPVKVTLIDKRNFHLFQPLLYQVATGGLSPADIAVPLREIFKSVSKVHVLLAEVVGLDAAARKVLLKEGELNYDMLVVASGSDNHYFGNDSWAELAPGLKTVENATEIRGRVLAAFESAEREPDPEKRAAWLTFAIAGAGPTGVEMAGALGEIAGKTLRRNFRNFDPADSRILLLDAGERALPSYPPVLSAKAAKSLASLGVTFMPEARVTGLDSVSLTVSRRGIEERIPCRTILWTAGVKASPLGAALASATGAACDRTGRVLVQPDLTLPGHPEIFVIGDLAHAVHHTGAPLPGIATVAMQQGRYVGGAIRRRLNGKDAAPFRYRHYGSMATIGRNMAVADMGPLRFNGFPAWLAWVFIHIMYIMQPEKKILIFIQWAWYYFTRNRSARLITGGKR